MKKDSSSNPTLSLSDARNIFGSRSKALVLEEEITDIETAISAVRRKKEETEDVETAS